MGLMDRLLDRQSAFGFTTLGDKNVCSECFGDDAIKEFIKNNAISSYCDYCDTVNENTSLIAVTARIKCTVFA
ncbi:hypothetical protein J1TS3_16650 [Siminovitchia fordii]|uniref:Uncharacterized protein n=1 Tax=Siminovitchia fordii TaxID=254759 RepID=A0ABQ4K4H2_9BACI|nr:hypothetical protein J1TS3_16650 [Siminovitchia fordii]